jgi:hypothetical protein
VLEHKVNYNASRKGSDAPAATLRRGELCISGTAVPRSRSAQSPATDAARVARCSARHGANVYRTFTGWKIMSTLTDEIKQFIVKGLAGFGTLRKWPRA